MENLQSFSQVYGIRKEEVRSGLGDEPTRQLTLKFLDTFPKSVYLSGLRKLRSRSMVEALTEGKHEKGNHTIMYENYIFTFYYRGTPIYKWDSYQDIEKSVHAGDYEDTPSTYNQRKIAKKAVKEFREALLQL